MNTARHIPTFYLLAAIGILAFQPASAETVSKSVKALMTVFLEELTWQEVDELTRSGIDTVIIPTGGTEQNGPHMVLGKHNYIVRYTAEKIAQQLANALVAPVIAYTPQGSIAPPEGHMNFAGTVSISEETFERLLEESARSFRQHGFKTIAFLGDSGGNQRAQKIVAMRLSNEWKDEGVRVLHVSDYYSDANNQRAWLLARGETAADVDGHAGISDTSELMAIYPKGVHNYKLANHSTEDYDTTGVTASSLNASRAYGEKLLALKIAAAVRQIRGE